MSQSLLTQYKSFDKFEVHQMKFIQVTNSKYYHYYYYVTVLIVK